MMHVWNTRGGVADAAARSRRAQHRLRSHHGSAAPRARVRWWSAAARENEIVVVSIFVNPSQFNDPKDLDRYPRTLDQDLALLREAWAQTRSSCRARRNCIRTATVSAWSRDSSAQVLEGAHRPGFLQGVMTVVLKLLNLVRADRAYFGEKDYQQLQIVTEMARGVLPSDGDRRLPDCAGGIGTGDEFPECAAVAPKPATRRRTCSGL